MNIGIANQIEYVSISCKQRITDPDIVYPINFKDYYSNQELELKLKENNNPVEPIYTTIQIEDTFFQLDEQTIANVKIENINNPLSSPLDEIFKLIQPEIKKIKDKKKEEQKISIPITEDKSTFIGHNLDKQQRKNITQLLLKNSDIFATKFSELRKTNVVYHSINTGDSYPIKQRAYRASSIKQDHIQKEIEIMEKDSIIQKLESPWSFPVVLVKKKNRKLQFCVDFRKLNSTTKKDTYPLPRIDEILDNLGNAKWFTSLDLTSGYWQVEVKEEDKEKTTFITKFGLYEFNIMLFELCNAPSTF